MILLLEEAVPPPHKKLGQEKGFLRPRGLRAAVIRIGSAAPSAPLYGHGLISFALNNFFKFLV
jgi:hypothetical protein